MLAIYIKSEGIAITVDKNVTDIELEQSVNAISKLSFTVYPNTNAYDLIAPSLTTVIAYDTFLNEVVFEGRVYSCDDCMDESGIIAKKIVCEDVLSYFCDTVVSNVTFMGPSTHDILGDNIRDIVAWLINQHNSMAPANRHVYLGNIVNDRYLKETVEVDNDNVFNILQKVIVDVCGWEFKVKYLNAKWYIDVATTFSGEGNVPIISGVNMLNISKKVSTEDVCSAIMPVGGVGFVASAYRENITPTRSGTAANWAEQARLTLHYYDHPEDPHPRVYNDKYIINEKLVEKYGFVAKTVVYDDLVAHDDSDFKENLDELYRRGCQEADALTDPEPALETNAIDLARGGYNMDSIYVGYHYRIQNPMMNIDTIMRVLSKNIKYDNPLNSTLKFGKSGMSMANDASKANVSMAQRYSANAFNAAKNVNHRLGGMSMRNLSQSDYDTMDTHLSETIYVATGNQGEIKLYKGDTEIDLGGGVENAAVVTNVQASSLITDEEVIFVDSTVPAKVVWGKYGNWFYCNGYPVLFKDSASIVAEYDTFFLDYSDEYFPAEVDLLYSSYGNVERRVIYYEISSIQLTTDSGVIKKRYTFITYYDVYRMVEGVWRLITDHNRPSNYSRTIDIDGNDEIAHVGLLLNSTSLTFNGDTDSSIALDVWIGYTTNNSPSYKVNVNGTSAHFYGGYLLKNRAEVIFAKGMTSTTMEVNT